MEERPHYYNCAEYVIQFTARLIHFLWYLLQTVIDCTALNKIQWCQGCSVIGSQGTRDPSKPLHFLRW